MTDWPAGLRVAPIREWPGGLTPDTRRRRSQFSANWRETTALLRRELRELGAKDAELLVAIPPQQFRLDGYPRATAKAEHPGVILSFDSRHGHLSYPCDTFTTWQDNLRAVALALEALRKVDRYGVTRHGEQYRGFAAIEAAPAADALPFNSANSARIWLLNYWSLPGDVTLAATVRAAKRATHPDHGGDAEQFRQVMAAEQLLRDAGLI